MAYDGKVLRQATLRFDEDKQRRQEQQRQRQQQVYQQCPELEGIQREIRGTMGEIIASALRRGTDPLPAIRVIRDKNLSLQAPGGAAGPAGLSGGLSVGKAPLPPVRRYRLPGRRPVQLPEKILCTGADPGAEPDAGHRQPEL